MKNLLLIAVTSVCFTPYLHAQHNSKAIAEYAQIAGNVKYYYPDKSIKPADWNKLSAYILQSWQVDSKSIKQPKDMLQDIQNSYAEMGLQISLYRKPPPANKYRDVAPDTKGKHWKYTGYGYSKNKYMLGPFAWAYNLFANPYGKALRKNTTAYYKQAEISNNLTFTATECYVQLHDSLWLGMPLNGGLHKQSEDFKQYNIPEDEEDYNFKLAYVIDEWNILYHFCPTVPAKETWLQHLENALNELARGTSLSQVLDKIAAATNDAHTNINPSYLTYGVFHKLGHTFYYKEPKSETSKGKLWQVLRYQGQDVESAYADNLSAIATPNSEAKLYMALRRMRASEDTTPIVIQVCDIQSGEIKELSLLRYVDNTIPGEEFSHGKRILADSAKGIYYIDLRKVGGSKIIRTLNKANCKGLILDIRGHAYASKSFMRKLVNEKCLRVNMVTPKYSFPDKNLLTYDTILDYVKPAKKHIDKPIALLCDEYTISSSETILATLQACANTKVIGRISLGTTGNAVIAPLYYSNKYYSVMPFTPTLALTKTGERMNGIVPDVHISKTLQNIINNEDEIFDTAVKYLQEHIK